ncbi:MAG TPA: tetratricopeptide repeat protein [Phycisphaerae bacterium]|nr:tetratricopeptide repeat protein [Phycisphaerae bacterium]
MNIESRERVKDLLSQAARRPAGERRAFIEQTAGNPEIAAEALDLLPMLDDSAFMSAPTGAGMSTPENGAMLLEAPGMQIGRYKLLQRVGEGGFGVVFMAEQTEPVIRRVALKIIKAGMDTRQVIARFEAERQALAMMDHPNIARVFDGGATEQGRPYFVMELVRGEPVTEYCDREHLSINDRLALFRDICGAVQHAHQKGIIHRDIKPSNILVTVADGRPLPKVIDFGIAKATSVRLTDKTLFTEIHQLIGTPEYMSPEQAEVSGVDIDTRSDVYSLGVLLYELLAGAGPFDRRRLRSAPFAEIQRIIRDEEPPRPSLRLRTMGSSNLLAAAKEGRPSSRDSSAIDIAQRRRTEPMLLARSLNGDLDWIVMKCLEKDRSRRYETASGLAGDVAAYLANQPVSATPPRAVYKFQKFVRRHRIVVIASAAIAATLLIATSVSIAFAVRASRSLAAEEAARRRADDSARETRQVAQFQSDLLSGIDVERMGRGFKDSFRQQVKDSLTRQFVGEWPKRRKLTPAEIDAELAAYDRIAGAAQPVDVARKVLDEYILGNDLDTVRSKFADQPHVQAELLHTLGVVCRVLGLLEKAEPALARAMELRQVDQGENEIPLADTKTELAATVADMGKYREAEQLHREALAIYRDTLGPAHHKTINTMNMVANCLFNQGDLAGAEALLKDALLPARALPVEHHDTLAQVLSDLGGLYLGKGDTPAAEPLIREALELRRSLPGNYQKQIADCLNNLAGVHYMKGDYAGVEQLLQEALEVNKSVLGDEHVVVATLLNNLASVRYEQNDIAGAKQLFEESLAMYRRLLGDEHAEVTSTLNNLAMVYQLEGDLKTSEPLLREALELRRRQLGEDHPDVGLSLANLGYQLQKQGDAAGAEPLFRQALGIYGGKYLPAHHLMISARLGLVDCLVALGKLDEAESILNSIDEKVGLANVPRIHRDHFIESFAEMFEARERAAPSQGYAQKAAEWRSKLAEEEQ